MIGTKDVIQVATQRMQLGLRQNPTEEALALMLSDQVYDAEEMLRAYTGADLRASRLGRRIVTYGRLMTVLDGWKILKMPELEAEMVLEDAQEVDAYANARLYDPPAGVRRSKRAHYLRLVEAVKAERESIESAF